MAEGNVTELKPDPPVSRDGSDGGGGGGDDGRFREVEKNLAELTTKVAVLAQKLEGLKDNQATRADIVRISTQMEHMATKEDIPNMKVWVLVGVLSTLFPIILTACFFLARYLLMS